MRRAGTIQREAVLCVAAGSLCFHLSNLTSLKHRTTSTVFKRPPFLHFLIGVTTWSQLVPVSFIHKRSEVGTEGFSQL